MELGETLIITASITSNTYLATRSKTNSEVTIRISPGASPLTPKRNTPRSPPPSLFNKSTKSSITMPTKLELDQQLPVPQDTSMIQGWAMVATQPQASWDIAWVCTTALPIPKISVMLESELAIKPCIPSQFEEIESIDEIEALPLVTGLDRTEPLKFEIKTKASKTYKMITNNFMTNGLRRLMTALASSTFLPSPNPDCKQLEISNRKSLPRVNTPKPPLSTNTEKSLSQLSLNDSNHVAKPKLGRTSALIPDIAQPAPALPLAQVARLYLQQRSASFDVIPPVTPNFKPAPRPVSLNVYDLIKNYDSPKSNDPRSFLKLHSTRSRLARKPSPRPIALVPTITHVASKLRMVEKSDDASDFSDCDDGASNFSEDMDENSLKESPNYRHKKSSRKTEKVLHCSDAEIRDLCERTKGLSPDINFILQQECYYDSDSDASSCFSEDLDDSPKIEAPRDETSDNFSDCSAVSSSVSGSGIFDSIAVGRSDPGIRRLQKANLKKSESAMSVRKTSKAEKLEKRKREKEEKAAARMSKREEKKREHKDEKHKDEKQREDKHKEEKHKDEKHKEENSKEEKKEVHKEDKHKDEKHIEGEKKKTLNGRVKSWLRIFGRSGAPTTECS